MCLVRGQIVATGVVADTVVSVHRAVDRLLCFIEASECLVQFELGLKNAVHSFSNGIFIRVSVFGHRYTDVVVFQQLHVLIAAVLRTSIAVVYQRGLSLGAAGHHQRIDGTSAVKCGMQAISNNAVRVGIGDDAQIAEALI